MPTTLTELLSAADALLTPGCFQDYCPNGLQVEGRPQIRCLISGVTASLALLEAARDVGLSVVCKKQCWVTISPRNCTSNMRLLISTTRRDSAHFCSAAYPRVLRQ